MIKLRFFGPYLLCSEKVDVLGDCPYARRSGIYLWAVKLSTGQYHISYIGETGTSFYKRAKEHIIQKLGGNYRICDPDFMLQGVQRVIWPGLWRKGTRNKMPEFLRRYEELAPLIKASLAIQVAFVAPFDGERRLRQRIEGAIAMTIRANTVASSLLPDDIRYLERKENESPIRVFIESGNAIVGLPKQLTA